MISNFSFISSKNKNPIFLRLFWVNTDGYRQDFTYNMLKLAYNMLIKVAKKTRNKCSKTENV